MRTTLVDCSNCRGHGRIYGGHPNDPEPSDYGSCPVCRGSGLEEVELHPITEAEVMEPPYDPTTQAFDEPLRHAPVPGHPRKDVTRRESRELLLDAAAHLSAAASAYRKHASRHKSQGRAIADPLFSTRARDFDAAAERICASIRRRRRGDK